MILLSIQKWKNGKKKKKSVFNIKKFKFIFNIFYATLV